MRYERGNVVIGVYKVDGFGKNPGLWIGTRDPNMTWKVASFGSEEKAQSFIEWFEYMAGLRTEPPEVSGNGRSMGHDSEVR